MDGVQNPLAAAVKRACPVVFVALLLAGCVNLEELALQSGVDPVTWEMPPRTRGCHVPPAADHVHPPGDRFWVGHREEELLVALGPPTFRLGKPSHVGGEKYVIDVYAEPESTTPGCIDSYKRNPCGAITAYECR